MAGKGQPAGNIKLGISLDSTSFGNTLDEINAKVKQAESNMRANLKAYDSAGRSYEALSQKTKDLSTVMEGQNAKVRELTKRRDEAISKYGEESKQVANLNTQINNATAKYNAYSRQLNDTKKELVYSKTAVNDLSNEIKENERQMNAEVKALKAAGDESGAFEAKQKGLTKQAELSERAMDEQRKVVALMADEFGDSADETEDARKELTKLERQSKLSDKQLEGLTKTTDVAGKEIDDLGDQATKSGRSIDGFKDRVSKTTGVVSNLGKGVAFMAKGAVFGAFATVGSKAVNMVSDSLDGAISRIDTLNNSDRAFSNMGFSAEETKKAMDNLQGAIKGLPTGLDGAVKGVQLLAGSTEDVGKSTEIFKAMNDGILGFGGNAEMVDNAIVQLSQSFSNGKVDAETWNSMINSGLGPTLNAMAKQMGKTTGELKSGLSDGSISVKDFQDRLIELDKNGGGGIKSLNQIAKDSTKGISTSISNAKTAVTRGVADMITNLNDGLAKNNLPTLSDMISNAGARAEAVFKKIGTIIPQVLGAIAPVVNKAIGVFKNLFTVFAENNDAKKYSKALFDLDKIIPMEVLAKAKQRVIQVKNIFNGIFATGEKQEKSLNILKMTGMTDETIDKIRNFTGDIKKLIGSIFGNEKADDDMLKRLGLKPDDIAKIKKVVEDIKIYFGAVFTNIQQMLEVAIEIAKGVFSTLAPYVIPIISKIGKALGDIGKSLTLFWEQNGKQIIQAIKNFFVFIQPVVKIVMTLMMSFIDNVIGLVKGLLNAIQGAIKIFTGLFTGDFSKMWEGVKQLFWGSIQAVWNWIQILFFKRILEGVKGLWTGFSGSIKGLWESTKTFFTEGISKTWDKLVNWVINLLGKAGNLKTTFGNFIKNMWNSVKNFFSNGVGDTWNKVVGWVKNIFNKATELKNNVSNVIGNLWNGIKDTFRRGIDTVFNWFSELPTKMKNAIIGGKNAIVDAFKGIFNAALKAIGKPVNAIIHGASWVLEKLGADKLEEWKVPQYAKGTPNGGHPGGPMMVNDGRGAEAVITPNGQAFIPRGRNVVLNAPKGTHVLTAEETAYMTGNKAPRYRYAKGTGFFGNLWNNVKGFAGDVGNKLKDVVGDVWDFVTDPGALARKVLNGLGVLEGLVKYPLDVGKGILSKATEALTNKITELFSSGSLDTSMGMQGVYKYLADVAVAVMKKFPGFQVTSGYREGDPYSHGKHNAIDIALPGVVNGSPRYTEAANYAFEKFANKIGYVITNGKVRDRSGQSGQPATGAWETWPDGDHYDHVHLNGVKDPQSTQISGDSVGGSGVERWRNVAIRALKMTGQYSTANLNALLNQMRTESNGNPNAVNNWDINAKNGTPSKGLLQVIDPTFRQYAMPGFNSNIFDPLSNILASIRYALSRYGSLTNAYRGVGYANGGIVNQHQIAEIAEGNKPEIIIPLDKAKRSRAMQLLAIAQDKLGVKSKSVNNSSDSSGTLETLVSLMIQQNNLLSKLLAKDTSVKLDGKAIAENTNGYLGNQLKRSLYTTG
ncbi:tape measure protein [Enterococcus faecium]|uniref:tape measure protein n=2 Tax=Enterococcus faecium TaxID=1352 RepID=UPI000CF05EFC|nr:tape measure protein [Enterococcus faecium]NTK10700.1 tape measure protein [Enterococcus faecium]NTM67840.1 tape measure protein [Enterococcus faecium]PQB80159.1 tape measure protein [Enterococcus faecium]